MKEPLLYEEWLSGGPERVVLGLSGDATANPLTPEARRRERRPERARKGI